MRPPRDSGDLVIGEVYRLRQPSKTIAVSFAALPWKPAGQSALGFISTGIAVLRIVMLLRASGS